MGRRRGRHPARADRGNGIGAPARSGPLPERHPTPHVLDREGERPRAIVLHTAVGTYDGTIAWFADPASGVSAHYLVGLDGRVAQFVDEAAAARHAGRVLRPSARLAQQSGADPNLWSIGIEFEDRGDPLGVARPEPMLAAGAALVAAVAARWSIPLDRDHVVGHREIYAEKECPGNLDVGGLVARAVALSA